tara:strand:+ start:143571 stop:143873 length:303 start_codon:yes stop_codon:yes gene_type:complete
MQTIPQNTVQSITRERATDWFWNETQGRIVSVTFQKADGSMRDMTCRRGVQKHLRGGSLPYDAKRRNLLPVFDMIAKGYRMVNLGTLVSFCVGGETFIIT